MSEHKIRQSNTLVSIYQSNKMKMDYNKMSEQSRSKIQFWSDFLKNNKLISCRIEQTSVVPKLKFHRSYTLYHINVLTEELYFTKQKRYSQFELLHKRIKKIKPLPINFPKKTYFQSSTQISTVSQRIVSLNQFINCLINDSNEISDVIFMLYEFLGIWDEYLRKGINPKNCQNEYYLANTENLYIEILKLSQNPKTIAPIYKRIRKLIFQYKIKISLENARQLFFGLEKSKKGLFDFAFNNKNQYVAIQSIELINDLLNPQIYNNSQTFLKTLQYSSSQKLAVKTTQLLENILFKKLYLELLKKFQAKDQSKKNSE